MRSSGYALCGGFLLPVFVICNFCATFTHSLYWNTMRTRLLSLTVLLVSFFTMSWAQVSDMYYVHFSDGRVWGYPKDFVKELHHSDGQYTLVLKSDSLVSWPEKMVLEVNDVAPVYPQFTAFELDDKLNDQLFRDVEAVVTPDEVWASVSGIGKYLTPTFEMDMPGAVAYANGVEQESGVSRLRFANDVVYTLLYPGYQRLSIEKVSDEVWSNPETGVAEIALTADMLSTNAPTSRENEGLGMMLDGDPNTIFHSTWSRDPVYTVDPTRQVYVSVDLPYAISELKFYYKGRSQSGYNILEWRIEASNDGEFWDYITTIDESMGIPTDGGSVSYTSDPIELGASYSHVRFVAARSQYKNYLCLAEFKLYEVYGIGGDPELIQPAEYAYQMVPMGREVPVHIDWLTDFAHSVPSIDIYIDGGEMVSSKEYYLDADIYFRGNGVWEDYDFEDRVKIKGRGNTSWNSYAYAKNPYRLKFDESVKPFGMKKGKNWNLIPQAQKGSLMTNPVAHKIARMIGLQTANDVIPVELYINGSYRGSYYFTQKVGMANNSVDFDDESMAALFELDSYYEDGQFSSYTYGLPVNIKDPEFGEDETLLDYYGVRSEFNRFETAVYYNNCYERFVDMDMLVRYMLVNDLVLNTELGHPKSTFLSRENMGHMASRYTFGPAWDFDWAYGYEGSGSYCTSGATRDLFSYHSGKVGNRFYSQLLRASKWVQYRYYRLWEEFMDKHLDELIDFVDDYYAYASSSFWNNYYMWGDGNNYNTNVANMKSWLVQRANYIKNSLTPFAPDAKEPFTYGDLNDDGTVDGADIECMLSCLFGMPEEGMNTLQADADVDEVVSLSDLTWINLLVGEEQEARARSRQRALWSDDEDEEQEGLDFDIDDMVTLLPSSETMSAPMRAATTTDKLSIAVSESSGIWEAEVSLTNLTPYIAYSMDIAVPKAFTLADGNASITLSYRTEGAFTMMGRWISDEVYRVIGYSQDNTAMTDAEGPLFTLSLEATSSLLPQNYTLNVKNVRVVTENAVEESLGNSSVRFEVTEEQASHIAQSLSQTPCWPADIYDLHGRLVRKAATSLEGLGKGVYIVDKQKLVR